MSIEPNPAGRRAAPAALLALVVGLLAIATVGFRTLATPSIWTHVANGREVLAHGIPHAPTLTYALPEGTSWVCGTWLYDVLMQFTMAQGGAVGLTVVHLLVVVAAFGLLGRASLRCGADAGGMALALALSAWMLLPGFSPQPALFGLFFAGLLHFIQVTPSSWKIGRWVLVVAQILWTNIHSSFLLGPLMALGYALDAYLAERRGSQPETAAKTLGIHAGILAAATLVNPYFLSLHIRTIALWMDPSRNLMLDAGTLFSGEFMTSTWLWSSYAAIAAIAAGFLMIRQNLSIGIAAPAGLAAYLLFRTGYLMPISAAIAFPFIATSLRAVAQSSGPGAVTGLRVGGLVASILIAGLTLTGLPYERLALLAQPGLGLQADAYPVDACSAVLARPAAGGRLLNLAQDGGFLASRLADRPIYTDDRGDLYGLGFYDQLAKALVGDDAAMRAVETANKPNLIAINACWPFAGTSVRALVGSGRWALCYFDGSTAVLARNTLENAGLTKDKELQQAGLRKLEAARARYEINLRSMTGNDNAARLIGAGHILAAMNLHKEAEAVYDLLTRGTPSMHGAWLALGVERVQMKRFGDGIEPLERAVAMRRKDPLALLWLGRALDGAGRKDEAERRFEEARAMNPDLVKNFLTPVPPARR